MAARRKTRKGGARLGVVVKGGVGKDDPPTTTTGVLLPRQPARRSAPGLGCALDSRAEQGEGHGAYLGPSSLLSCGAGAPPCEGEPDALPSTSLGRE